MTVPQHAASSADDTPAAARRESFATRVEPVVECRGLTKVYGAGDTAVQALRGVDLVVQPGELLMLVGPSGCGKTTLISIIASVLDGSSGTCRVLGRDMLRMPERDKPAFRLKHLGFCFQSFNLNPCLNAAENVAVPLLIGGRGYGKAIARAQELLRQVGLGDKLAVMPDQLSGGQQQRVAIARAFAQEPDLIVCDEPTSALDSATGEKVLGLLREMTHRSHRSVIVVTHDARIFRFADRIVAMDDGCIVPMSAEVAQTAPVTVPGRGEHTPAILFT
jgi:putative ABC transport system ATP-binding protein